MNLTEEQLEYVVREVMRRLAELGVGKSAAASNELTLAGRLVTLRDLEGKLTNVTQLTVAKQAVVTPAVRDLLREKKIELVRRA